MDITNEIFDMLGEAPDNFNELSYANKLQILNKIDLRWDNLPEDKYECEDKSMLALFMIPELIKLSETEKADKWTEILLLDRLDDNSQTGLYRGIINFEKKNYEEAYKNFDLAFKDSQNRIFEGEDPKYLEFYKNPEKYIK